MLEVMHLLILNKRLAENFAQFHLGGLSGACFCTYILQTSSQSPDLKSLPDSSEARSGHEVLQWRRLLPFLWTLNRI